MNNTVRMLLSLVFVGMVFPSAWAQLPGQVAKASRAASRASALGRMDALAQQGKSAAAAARVSRVKVPAVPVRSVDAPLGNVRWQFEHFVLRSINPTPTGSLRPRLVSPTLPQAQEAIKDYETFFADFAELRKELDPVLGNALLENVNLQQSLPPMELSYYITKLSTAKVWAVRLQNVLFPTDAGLKSAVEYLDFASQKFDKFYTPEVPNASYQVRPYVQEEFWMEYDWRKGPRDESLTQLPENVHMAVLNDTQSILDMYKQWESQGRFPKGWKVSVYEDTLDLLNAMNSGMQFGLIISDIHVPGGGGRFLVSEMRQKGIETPVIGCSMYTRDQINSEELHNIGFDGYMYGDDMFEESAGFVKWNGYIKNFYYYQRMAGLKL